MSSRHLMSSTPSTMSATGHSSPDAVLTPPAPSGAVSESPGGPFGPFGGSGPWRGVAVFSVLALGLAGLASLPLYFGGGLADPAVYLWVAVAMTTPAIAAIVATARYCPRGTRLRLLRIHGGRDGSSWRRTAAIAVLAAGAAVALSTVVLLLSAILGLADLAVGPGTTSSLLLVLPLSVVIGVTAVGEELGWRGYLHTALRPLGPEHSLLVNGVLWGV